MLKFASITKINNQITMIKNYVEENKDRMLEELFSLIRIPSVSAQPAHKEDMVRCAERWKELLLEAGVDKAEVMPSRGIRWFMPSGWSIRRQRRYWFTGIMT